LIPVVKVAVVIIVVDVVAVGVVVGVGDVVVADVVIDAIVVVVAVDHVGFKLFPTFLSFFCSKAWISDL